MKSDSWALQELDACYQEHQAKCIMTGPKQGCAIPEDMNDSEKRHFDTCKLHINQMIPCSITFRNEKHEGCEKKNQ